MVFIDSLTIINIMTKNFAVITKFNKKKEQSLFLSNKILSMILSLRSVSTKTLPKWPKGLSNLDLLNVSSTQKGVPIMLAIAYKILGLQYSCERS